MDQQFSAFCLLCEIYLNRKILQLLGDSQEDNKKAEVYHKR